jgi:hypothetical protein
MTASSVTRSWQSGLRPGLLGKPLRDATAAARVRESIHATALPDYYRVPRPHPLKTPGKPTGIRRGLWELATQGVWRKINLSRGIGAGVEGSRGVRHAGVAGSSPASPTKLAHSSMAWPLSSEQGRHLMVPAFCFPHLHTNKGCPPSRYGLRPVPRTGPVPRAFHRRNRPRLRVMAWRSFFLDRGNAPLIRLGKAGDPAPREKFKKTTALRRG